MQLIKSILAGSIGVLIAATTYAAPQTDEAKQLNQATRVLSEIRNASDNGIPAPIWSKAHCVVVIPELKKAGFIVGGENGEGVMSCRQGSHWSAPIFMQLTKASFGLQAGIQSTELVLVVTNQSGIEKLLNNKVTLGGDVSIAAGPVGRSASAATDAQMTAEMLSYSRSKGLFAGINLSGGSLRADDSANERVYGKNVVARDIALGRATVPLSADARAFTRALSRDVAATSGVK